MISCQQYSSLALALARHKLGLDIPSKHSTIARPSPMQDVTHLRSLTSPWLCQIAIEHGHRKFVSFPINSMVIFHSYVNVYQRVAMKLLNGPMVQYDMVHVWQNGQRLSSQGGPVIYVMHTRCMEYSKKLEGFKGGWQPKQLWCPEMNRGSLAPSFWDWWPHHRSKSILRQLLREAVQKESMDT